MKNVLKPVFALFFALMFSVCAAFPAFAEEASVIYDGSAQKFVFAPGSNESLTDLFTGFKGVMPGDSLTQKITVKNDEANKVKVQLYLRSLGASAGSEEFLSQMNLTVTQDGNSELFAASADKTGGLADWVCLGTFYSGADIDLNVALNVPIGMDDTFQDAVGKLEWQFKAEEMPVEVTDPKPPQTGDSSNLYIWIFLFAVSAAGMVFALLSFRKRNKQ